MRKYISLLLLMLAFLTAGFKVNYYDVDGLSVKFRKVSEDYVMQGGIQQIGDGKINPGSALPPNQTVPVYAEDGMKFVKLKLTLINNGNKNCVFDFADVYISTEQDSLYRLVKLQSYFGNTKTKIKPGKEIDRIAFFEFPDKAKPKELFIEDKRYTIKVED